MGPLQLCARQKAARLALMYLPVDEKNVSGIEARSSFCLYEADKGVTRAKN
jgi:hypothetical protein